MFIALTFLSSKDNEILKTPSYFSPQDASKHACGGLGKSVWKFDPGQGKKSWPGVKFSNWLFKITRYFFDASWREKYDGVFNFSLSLLDKKLSAINIFLKNGHFLFKVRRTLISYYIHLKSQHIIVRPINGLCSSVFGFALAVIVFLVIVDLLAK